MRCSRSMLALTLALVPVGLSPAAAQGRSGAMYQMVIAEDAVMTVRNGQGEFVIRARNGKVSVSRTDAHDGLNLVKDESVYRVEDERGGQMLIFAVRRARGHGMQIIYVPHADPSNSRARIGLSVGSLEEVASTEDQRKALRDRLDLLGLAAEKVLLVKSVVEGSPAAQSGLLVGDPIVQAGSFESPSEAQLQNQIYSAEEGAVLLLTTLSRGGKHAHRISMPPLPEPVSPADLEYEITEALKSGAAAL